VNDFPPLRAGATDALSITKQEAAQRLTDADVLLSVEEIMAASSCSERTVRESLVADLRSVKLGRCVRVRLSDWRAFLAARTAS